VAEVKKPARKVIQKNASVVREELCKEREKGSQYRGNKLFFSDGCRTGGGTRRDEG
jgi:hypothetical protein